MDRDHIRFGEQRIKINLIIAFLRRCAGGGEVYHAAAESARDISNASADRPEPDNAPGFSFQFKEGLIDIGKDGTLLIISAFDEMIIVWKFLQQIEEAGKCVLRDRFCCVSGDICPCNSSLMTMISASATRSGISAIGGLFKKDTWPRSEKRDQSRSSPSVLHSTNTILSITTSLS